MALNLNKVVIAGRLTRDPEVKTTQSGLAVCTFSVAVNKRVAKDAHPEADFFTVTAWRERAEFVGKYFRKGSAICVCGQLTVNRWEDRNGNKRQDVQIVADDCLFVESKGASDGAQDEPAQTAPTQTSVYAAPQYDPYQPQGFSNQAAQMSFQDITDDYTLPF